MLNYKSIISHSFDRIDPPIIVLVVISLSLRIKQIELCYMNKTNIGWLRDNRELYLIEIKIKRGPHNTRIVHIAAAQVSTTAVIHVLITIKVLFSIVLSFLHEATSDLAR